MIFLRYSLIRYIVSIWFVFFFTELSGRQVISHKISSDCSRYDGFIVQSFYNDEQSVALAKSIIVGGVTATSARFRGALTAEGAFAVQLSTSPDFINTVPSGTVTVNAAGKYAGIVEVTGLTPNTRYYYRAVINNIVTDSKPRSFNTFQAPGTASTFSFAFGSCQQSGSLLPSGTPAGNVFKEVVKRNPRFFLQLGDWGYPDTTDNLPFNNNFFSASYDLVQNSYQARFDTAYFMDSVFRTMPIDYIYDDHDFMNDNASAKSSSFGVPFRPNPLGNDFIVIEFPNPAGARENSIRGYKEHMPGYPIVNESRGIYHKFTYGNVEFFALDLRAQRSGNLYSVIKNPTTERWEYVPDSGRTLLGNANSPGSGNTQLSWFLTELKNSTAKWKFILSSVPFNKSQAAAIHLGIALQDSILNVPPGLLPPGTTGIFATHEFVDKWAGYPTDLDSVLRFIQANNITNTIVLSGDSHTAAIDNGVNAGLPEIMAGGLDITNSRMASLFASFGLNIWNQGGQGLTTPLFNNAFGNITVYGNDSVRLQLIDEFAETFAAYTVHSGQFVPVELISFTANESEKYVQLNWKTASEKNNSGFEIQRLTDNSAFSTIGFIAGKGTTTEQTSYTFYDTQVSENSVSYRLKQIDFDGSYTYSHLVSTSPHIVREFEVYQNFPNPFNPETQITFRLAKAGKTTVKLFDVTGKELKIFLEQVLPEGMHTIHIDLKDLSSGMYIYQVSSGKNISRKKMMLVK